MLIRKLGYKIVSIDLYRKRNKLLKKHKLNVIKCDIEEEKFPFPNEHFDMIIFSEVLEHLGRNPLFAIKEIKRVLKFGGIVIVTTPNLYSLGNIARFLLGKSFNNAVEVFQNVMREGYIGHIREYSTRELKIILKINGFNVLKTFKTLYRKTNLLFLYKLLPQFRPYQVIIAKKVK